LTEIETGIQTAIRFIFRRREDRILQFSFDRSRILRQLCLAEFEINTLSRVHGSQRSHLAALLVLPMARTSLPSPDVLIQAKLVVAKDQAQKKRLKAAKTKKKGASKMRSVTESMKENQAPVSTKGITIS
jgi:hypothetical protein